MSSDATSAIQNLYPLCTNAICCGPEYLLDIDSWCHLFLLYLFGSDHPSLNKIYWWITVWICYSIIGFSVFSLDLFGHGWLSALLYWHLIFELDDWSLLSVFYPGVWSVVSEPEYISSLHSACSAWVFFFVLNSNKKDSGTLYLHDCDNRSLIYICADNRKEKSLGLLTQNFVKLFLTANVIRFGWFPNCNVSFLSSFTLWNPIGLYVHRLIQSHLMKLQDYCLVTVMARQCWQVIKLSNSLLHPFLYISFGRLYYMPNLLLIDNSAAKVRRLYDIANVLTSLNLIEKVRSKKKKKRYLISQHLSWFFFSGNLFYFWIFFADSANRDQKTGI